jgi:hypothetical protein
VTGAMLSRVLIITQRVSTGDAIARWLDAELISSGLRVVTFDQLQLVASTSLLQSADAIVLELFRRYPDGSRAEGLLLAERFLKPSVRMCLVETSPETRAKTIPILWWPGSLLTIPALLSRQACSMAVLAGHISALKGIYRDFLDMPSSLHNPVPSTSS